MSTILVLCTTQNNNPTNPNSYDLLTDTTGHLGDSCEVDTVASASELQWSKTRGGSAIEWVTLPIVDPVTITTQIVLGFTAKESNGQANCKFRAKFWRRPSGNTDNSNDVLMGSADDTSELTTSITIRNVTITLSPSNIDFYSGDQLVCTLYIYNSTGDMGGGRYCTLNCNDNSGNYQTKFVVPQTNFANNVASGSFTLKPPR